MAPTLTANCGKVGPQLIRAGELALALASSSIQENGPCTSLGNTVELSLMAQVSQSQKCESKRADPTPQRLQHTREWGLRPLLGSRVQLAMEVCAGVLASRVWGQKS